MPQSMIPYGRAASLALLIALQGCHTVAPTASKEAPPSHKGEVSYQLVPATGAAQYKLKKSEHSFGAQPLTNEPPVYPPSLVAANLPLTTVRVKAIIDQNGKVSEVRNLDTATSRETELFVTACRDAMLHWTYSPMTVVEEFDDGKGNITQVRKNAPFSLDYAFKFELVDGRPTVTSSR